MASPKAPHTAESWQNPMREIALLQWLPRVQSSQLSTHSQGVVLQQRLGMLVAAAPHAHDTFEPGALRAAQEVLGICRVLGPGTLAHLFELLEHLEGDQGLRRIGLTGARQESLLNLAYHLIQGVTGVGVGTVGTLAACIAFCSLAVR